MASAPAAGGPGHASDSSRSQVFGLDLRDLAVAMVVGALVIAFVPATLFPSWTARMAVLLCVAFPGVVLLVKQTVTTDRAAGLAVAFIAVAISSSVLSDSARSSAIGFVGRDQSVVTIGLAFAAWALARTVSSAGGRVAGMVFVGSATFAAAIGIVQVVAQLDSGSLALLDGRPGSLLVNPVYFGAICAAGAVAAARSASGRIAWWHAAAVLTSAACVLSGSRVAWAAVVVLIAAQLVSDRSPARRSGAVAVAAGLGVGVVLDRVFSAGANSIDRATSGSASGRFTAWGYAIEAWAERPLLGHGIGLFRPAVQGRFSTEFVRTAAFDDSRHPWFDAHNVVIATLVATGLVGLLALAAWLFFAARRASGPAAWAAGAISITWLLQPVSLTTLPIAMILLGVAAPLTDSDGRPASLPPAKVMITATLVSTLLGLGLLVADLRLKSAVDDASLEAAESAAAWFPGDPIVANVVAQVAKLDGGLQPNASSVEWRRRAAEREPDRPYWWNLLAEEHLQLGDVDAAQRAVDEALRLQPSNYASNRLALDLAILRADRDEIERRLDVLCELDGIACGLDADELLAGRG